MHDRYLHGEDAEVFRPARVTLENLTTWLDPDSLGTRYRAVLEGEGVRGTIEGVVHYVEPMGQPGSIFELAARDMDGKMPHLVVAEPVEF